MAAKLSPKDFDKNLASALSQPSLKHVIRRTTDAAEQKRAAAVARYPNFDGLRKQGQQIKDHVIKHMAYYLEQFETNANANGATVHWAKDAEQARTIVMDICRSQNGKLVTRSKSMLGEEIGLSHALDNSEFERVETDLAEHIIQLAEDPPSHIVWPAMHRSKQDVIELFKQNHRSPTESEDIEALVKSARRHLRDTFLKADIGISGANFLLADSGSSCTVTNEGNAELSTTPPKVHIVTAGIEKLVPSMAHAMPLIRLLTRSATGGEITQYITFHNGPKRQGDPDGPEQTHIVLVDNGRTDMLVDQMKAMLRCIRCGACMNHCVVYKHIGGHAYGSVYPGPMGSVLSPHIYGLDQAQKQTHACTLNGRCAEVCPVNIPLPTLLRSLRAKSWQHGYEGVVSRTAVTLFSVVARYPTLFHLGANLGPRFMRFFKKGLWISAMPLTQGWTANRDLKVSSNHTFFQQYKANKHKQEGQR